MSFMERENRKVENSRSLDHVVSSIDRHCVLFLGFLNLKSDKGILVEGYQSPVPVAQCSYRQCESEDEYDMPERYLKEIIMESRSRIHIIHSSKCKHNRQKGHVTIKGSFRHKTPEKERCGSLETFNFNFSYYYY